MSLIVVFESNSSDRERIESALSAEGWQVEMGSATSDRDPDLVLVSTAHDRASELVGSYCRDRGGPGVLVLVEESEEYSGPGEATLEKPFTERQLRASVRRCLAKLQREAAEAAAREAASTGAQLTSAELFGDMLAEVEAEGDEASTGASEPLPDSDETPSAPARAPKSRKRRASEDLDAQIEETLSGVLGSAGRTRSRGSDETGREEKSGQRRGQEDDDLDALLDQTLSGLGVGKRRKKKPKSTRAPSPPEAPEDQEREKQMPEPGPPDGLSPEEEAAAKGPERPAETSFPGEDEETGPGPGVEEARRWEDAEEVSPADSVSDVEEQFATQRMEAIRPEDLEPPPTEEPSPPRPEKESARDEPDREEPPEAEEPSTGEVIEGPPETEPPPESREEAGEETFGQYTLLERVAVGGMAEVWKARMQGMEGFQKTVAIKRILPHLTDSSDFVTMFIDEAKLAAQLNHPHIIHIYDLGKIDEDYYIAMEYVEGKDLRSILNTAREGESFPQELALLVAGRLASGLDYAHRKRDFEDRELGLVHRDVSPQNVLISYEGDIKLCDFGIVKAVAKASKTQMGALKGKLQYMSPEQAWGRVVDARSDIFSLGTVLFEMLTGQRLFAGDSELSVLEAVRECRVRSPRDIDPGISEDVERIVDRALRKDPDDRYQTAGEMQEEIESLLYELKPTPSQGDLGSYVRDLFGAEALPTPEPAAPAEPWAEEELQEEEEDDEAVAAMPPRGEMEEDEESSSWAVWAGLAAGILLVAAVAGWLVLRPGSTSAPEGEAAPTRAAETVEAESPVSAPVPGPTPGGAAEEPDSGGSEQSADEAEGPSADGEENESVDLEALVDAELEERDAELQRRFEEEKRRLEAEIAAARVGESEASGPDEEGVEEPEAAEPEATATEPVEPESLETEVSLGEDPESEPVEAAGEEPAQDARESGPQEPDPQAEESALPVEEVTEPPAETDDIESLPADPESASGEAGDGEKGQTEEVTEPTAPRRGAETAEPTPQEPEEARVRRGELVESETPGLIPPRLVSIDKPEYPPIARRMKVQGTVVVSVLVDENGKVLETRLVQGVSEKTGLDQAALEAAETASFEPSTVDGVPVKSWFNLRIPFRL